MKILGLHGGHDSAYAILEDGVPVVHNELERFNRQKGCKGDSLKLFLPYVGISYLQLIYTTNRYI